MKCPACKGRGTIRIVACPRCKGTGKMKARRWNDGGFRKKIWQDIFDHRDVPDEHIEDMARLVLDMTKPEHGGSCRDDGYDNSEDAIEVIAQAVNIVNRETM